MNAEFSCSRCNRTGGRLPKPPLPGAAGEEVQENICAVCWGEWENMEVMVINELRLDFMDPRAQDVLLQHMRQFLMLEGAEPQS
jgi:Fe-S cluster biosynthesis and repair protein YggX